MGCCQTTQYGISNLNEDQNSHQLTREVNEHTIEFISNVVNLSANQSKEVKETYEPKKESMVSKDSEISKDRVSTIKDSKMMTSTPAPGWQINNNMFVRLNSKKSIYENYAVLEPIGQGGFGKVYKVEHKATRMIRAMKVILKERMKREDQQKLLEECSIMMDMDHPNIVKIFEMYTDEHSYYLVSEFCEGGELFEKIRQFQFLSEKEIASYLKQILSAISYCHSKGIVHRDLKPENILFDSKAENSNVKVIDFGASAKLENQEKLKKRIGTPFYVAPEVLFANYDEKCDIWSCGVILYILLCGYPPFFGNSEQEVLQKVKKGTFTFDYNDWSKVSMGAKDLIRRMLFFEPNSRISAIDAYNHHWIQDNKVKGQLNNLALKKLSDFDSKNKLKYAILQYISVQMMSTQEKDELLKNFQDLDGNGDGMLSKDELLQAYVKVYKGDKIAAQQLVDELFQQLDANGSGKVDFSEFVTASSNNEKTLSKKKIEQSFKLFDLDNNGFITKSELNELFGGNIDEQMWQEILHECDTNGDGQISMEEFIKLIDKKLSTEKNYF